MQFEKTIIGEEWGDGPERFLHPDKREHVRELGRALGAEAARNVAGGWGTPYYGASGSGDAIRAAQELGGSLENLEMNSAISIWEASAREAARELLDDERQVERAVLDAVLKVVAVSSDRLHWIEYEQRREREKRERTRQLRAKRRAEREGRA